MSPDTVCAENRLVEALKKYGKTSKIPLLWVSAKNDHFVDSQLTARLKGAFSEAGGKVTFVEAPSLGSDGHLLFYSAEGGPIWEPIVDQFLKANNLVFRDQLIDVTTPTVAPPSGLLEGGRDAFAKYLEGPPNKAFAVDGKIGHGGWHRQEVETENALNNCASTNSAQCVVVNVNDNAVK